MEGQLPVGGADDFLMRRGIGYTGLVPGALLGAGTFHMIGGSAWGLYADVQMTPGSIPDGDDFLDSETRASIEARPLLVRELIYFVAESQEWLSLNGAVLRALTPHMAIGVGGGMIRKRAYREYIDQSGEPELPGTYFIVRDEENTGWEPNAMANILVRMNPRLGFMIGYQTTPRSLAIGAFLTF